jgi:O-antigen ligase
MRDWRIAGLVVVVVMMVTGFQWLTSQDGLHFERIRHRYLEIDPFENDSFDGRLSSWESYWEVSRSHPFGVGYDRSLYEFSEGNHAGMTRHVAGAHSEFLKLLVELGWLPFAMFAWLNARALWLTIKPSPNRDIEPLQLGITVMFAAVVSQLCTNNEMQQPEVAVFYWFLLGNLLSPAQ